MLRISVPVSRPTPSTVTQPAIATVYDRGAIRIHPVPGSERGTMRDHAIPACNQSYLRASDSVESDNSRGCEKLLSTLLEAVMVESIGPLQRGQGAFSMGA